MTINAKLALSNEKDEIILTNTDSKIIIFYSREGLNYDKNGFYLLFKEKQLQSIHSILNEKSATQADTFVQIIPPESLDNVQLIQRFTEITQGNNLQNITEKTLETSKNHRPASKDYLAEVILLLEKLGFSLVQKKKTPAKVQHRWKKALSEIEFFVDDFGSQATVIWQKHNEMLIKKGAQLRKEYNLNKDGSVGLDARMGTQLREEQKDKIQNFITTEDIILKSVNEVGLFLYYGGTNSWLVLKDQNNKAIDEWAVVKAQ
ncbi:MAG: hypothetical protein L0L10_11450 [Tetragenococcus sp.]|nr:hypothetical protein [Tetragenococcus sp.]